MPRMPGPVALNVLDLSQDWDTDTPRFARYDGPTIKWVNRVAFEGVGDGEAAFCRFVAFV